ncbi:MaoC/PaaZ C-terminal domain-containing protein [Natronomonas marina]|jgi:acyl dehydratase|uniref:MaoC/PaaZ C-terminal domain-containing protein n=1 Tax=Natronomonas marina TaxID=2961939 RepID=UPI0020C9D6D5|nr:MaoC/PaaZ C-terminal domain-containing protein [Natronomonas marina]
MTDPELHFEDFEVGDRYEFGSHEITEAEITAFAERYDPQRPHLDPEMAEETEFGELVASGLHTLCVCCRMAVDELFARTAVVAGIGFDRLRFLRPVRPSDELSGWVEVVRTEPSDDHRGGYVDFELVGVDQNDDPVVRCVDLVIVESRGR